MEKKILCVDDSFGSYYRPFKMFGRLASNPNLLTEKPDEILAVVFTGGSDVNPSIYGEDRNLKTHYNPERDEFEKAVFEKAVSLGLPIIGICRGSQLCCALQKEGLLVQHIQNHGIGGVHPIKTDDGRIIQVTSTHHQNQTLPKGAIAVAWAEPKRSKLYEGAPNKFIDLEKEYDVVFYPDTNALGIQYHPEYMDEKSTGFTYVEELCKRFFGLQRID